MVMENDDECDDDDDADDNEGGEKWKLRGLAMRKLSVLPFVCPSVCLSNVCILTKRKKDLSTFLTTRWFSLVFWEEEWLVGATPFTWNFASTGPSRSVIPDFEPIFARSASAVTPSEKVQLPVILIGSPLRTFQWAQDEHRTLSKPPMGAQKRSKVSRIWTISCDNSETVQDRMSVAINH